MIKVA